MGFSLASRGGSPAKRVPGHKNPASYAGYGHIAVACFGRSDRGGRLEEMWAGKTAGGEGRGLSERLAQANIDGIGLYCTSTSVVLATSMSIKHGL